MPLSQSSHGVDTAASSSSSPSKYPGLKKVAHHRPNEEGSPSIDVGEISVDVITTVPRMGSMIELPKESLAELTDSLQYINPFAAKRHADMHHPVYMREILATGKSCSLDLSLRQLQTGVNRASDNIDLGDEDAMNSTKHSFSDPSFAVSPKKTSKFNVPFRSNTIEIVDDPDISVGAIHLRIRDLRRLDFNLNPSEEPSFWVRKHAVLISIDPIRAVVMASRIIIIIPPGGMDRVLEILERHLRDCAENSKGHTISSEDKGLDLHGYHQAGSNEIRHDSQFEITAFEAILATVSSLHNQQFKALSEEAQDALSYFDTTSTISVLLPFPVQEKMRNVKNELSALRSRIVSLETALRSLIEEPDNMALMNLTKLGEDPSLYRLPLQPKLLAAHEEIEELLEAYLVECNNQEASLSNLLMRMQNAEQLMSLKLDTARNQILVTNMSLQVATLLITFGAYITGIFGMNLDNTVTIQPIYGVFTMVSILTLVFIIVGNLSVMYYYERTGVVPATIRIHNHLVARLKGATLGSPDIMSQKSASQTQKR